MKETCIRVYADHEQIRQCRERVAELETGLQSISSELSLAGNPVRLSVLFLLNEEKMLCPCDIADILGMTVSAISQHLRKLKDGGLINPKRVAQTVFYSLKKDSLPLLRPIFSQITMKNMLKLA